MDWKNMPEGKSKYAVYLASREWGLKKVGVMDRCGGKCERCWINPADNVHHLTYERIYDEDLHDLQGLSRGCHKFNHAISNDDPRDLHIIAARSADSAHVLLCPFCKFEYVHFSPPEYFDGEDASKARHIMDVRGSVVVIHFWCESGHFWDELAGFHKGNTYRSIVPRYDLAEADERAMMNCANLEIEVIE